MDFISTPVMGGFISGIAVTIILMQVPKLMGSPAGSGELLNCQSISDMRWGRSTCCPLHGCGCADPADPGKEFVPKFPMAIQIMILGVLATVFFHVDKYGVTLLSAVEPGLPHFVVPQFQKWI